MAFTKMKKRTYKKTYKRKSTNSIAALSKRVSALARITKPEFKVIQRQFIVAREANTDGLFLLLNACSAGTDFTNRTGRVQNNMSLQYHMRLLKDGAVGTNYGYFAIILDKTPSQNVPNINDVYSTAQGQFRNLDNRKRFVILKTQSFTLDQDDPERNYSGYMKLNFKTIYDNTGETISDIISGALYCFAWSNQPAGDGAGLQFDSRIRFTDC